MDIQAYLVGKSILLADQFTTAPYYNSVAGSQTGSLTGQGGGSSLVTAVQAKFTFGQNELWIQLEDYPPVWVVYGDGVYVFADGTPVAVDQASIDAATSLWSAIPGITNGNNITSWFIWIVVGIVVIIVLMIVLKLKSS